MQDLKKRFYFFAIKNGELIRSLPYNNINKAYCNQLIRSSNSPGTNYRAALRGKSTADFINKLKIAEEELDESIYFLELLLHFNNDFKESIHPLIIEGNELLAITVKSIITTRSKNPTKR
jgi:four helix bundle protein